MPSRTAKGRSSGVEASSQASLHGTGGGRRPKELACFSHLIVKSEVGFPLSLLVERIGSKERRDLRPAAFQLRPGWTGKQFLQMQEHDHDSIHSLRSGS